MKNWYSIKALAKADTAEITINSEIGIWGISARQFLADFKSVQEPNVDLIINSPGGSIVDAIAMFNGMKASGKKINTRVLGIAASAASYLMMVGEHRTMPSNTMMFLHNPINSMFDANAEDMRDMAEVLDKFSAGVNPAYAARFKGTPEELQALLDDETFLSAEECLAYGLCDEVTAAVTVTASFDTDNLPEHIQALFKVKEVISELPEVTPEPTVETVPAVPAMNAGLIDGIRALCKTASLDQYAAYIALDPTVTSIELATQAVFDAREIHSLAVLAQLPEQAAELIKMRKSLPDARAAICQALADADIATKVDTAEKSPPKHASGGSQPLNANAIWAERQKHSQGRS